MDGAWDGKGYHAAGAIEDGSGSGAFEGVSGRVAQLNGAGADAGAGTFMAGWRHRVPLHPQ